MKVSGGREFLDHRPCRGYHRSTASAAAINTDKDVMGMGDGLRFRAALIVCLAVASALLTGAQASATVASAGKTFPVSWLKSEPGEIFGTNAGTLGMGNSANPISDNGRYVIFPAISNLLDTDGLIDELNIFRRDMQTGKTVLVSRGDGQSGTPFSSFYSFDLSADGNLVLITTEEKVTADDPDTESDVYLRDVAAGTTTLVSPGTSSSVYESRISGNGQFVVFTTQSALVPGDVNGLSDVYRYRIADETVDIVSRIPALPNAGNAETFTSAISGDGRWVAMTSRATNLIPGFTDNNGPFSTDIFLRDMTDGVTYLVSSKHDSSTAGSNGESGEPDLAGNPVALNQVRVAFGSYGTNLADNGVTDPDTASSVYVKSMPSQSSELVSRASGPAGANADSRAHTPSISNDGSRIIFSSDAGNLGAGANYYGVYLRDRNTSTTSLASARNEYAVFGLISGNGGNTSWAEAGGGTPDSDPDLQGVFRRNLNTNEIRYVSRPKGSAKVVAPGFTGYSGGDGQKNLSANGRYMAFSTWSSHLPGTGEMTEQIYRRDLATGEIVLVSRASGANGAISESASEPSISDDGNRIAFVAWNSLDPGDTNDKGDVYVRDLTTATTLLASRADGAAGAVGDANSNNPVLDADGSTVAFETESTNLGYGGGNSKVFVRELDSDQTRIVSRASGEAGATANGSARDPVISSDGTRVLFASGATNLSPDDASNSGSFFVRDLAGNQTILVTREPGLAGTSLGDSIYEGTLSADGNTAAFTTSQSDAVPASAPWPAFSNQIVVRNLVDGTNALASASPAGVVGDSSSSEPRLSGDGSIAAFTTDSTNIRSDVSVSGMESVAIKDMSNGTTAGPPLFGSANSFLNGSREPQVSTNGNCVLFTAQGHNEITGVLGSMRSMYLYVRSGTCQDPKALVPQLSGVSLKPARFRVSKKPTAKASKRRKRAPAGTKIRFTLNTKATVMIRFDQKLKGRKAGKKCVKPTAKNRRKKACKRLVFRGKLTRKNLAAGKRTVPFSGRIGRKALKPGKYRAVVQAFGPGGSSVKTFRSFRVVK